MDQPSFGEELRRLREQCGFSLKKFAKLVNYDPGYLSKIENGLKPPNATVATKCDEVLKTSGRLARLASDRTEPARQRHHRSGYLLAPYPFAATPI